MVWFILIVGIGWILFNIFLNSGGQAKFKSDLPKQGKPKRKVGLIICFSILSVLTLVLLIVALISFLS